MSKFDKEMIEWLLEADDNDKMNLLKILEQTCMKKFGKSFVKTYLNNRLN